MAKTNVVLIGMPGAGKSTAGVLLAKTLGMSFVDTDLCLQAQAGRVLQDIIEAEGVAGFLTLEAEIIRGLSLSDCVIATGGSAVYSDAAMTHLRRDGLVIYLKVEPAALGARLLNMASRGIAMEKGKTLSGLYRERAPLYEKYADLALDCTALDLETAVAELAAAVKPRLPGRTRARST